MSWGSGRGGRPWRRLRERVMRRDQYLCVPCRESGRLTPAEEVDHIIPVAKGGKDEEANLRSICVECHRKVTAQQARDAVSKKVAIGVDGWPIT